MLNQYEEQVPSFAEFSTDSMEGVDEPAIIVRSELMRRLIRQVDTYASYDSSVLITGPTGAGKELIARRLHTKHEFRRNGPFIAINCGAIPDGLFESLFFGHVRGAFTGAQSNSSGYLVQANGGTLFLDEIGEMPLPQQAKLLRVLESRSVVPVGGNKARPLDSRLIAATNRNLREEIEANHFRGDLYYRLAVVELFVPGLDDRGTEEKIALFDFHFERIYSQIAVHDALSSPPPKPPMWLRLSISQTPFPGNVRQLINLTERIAILRHNSGEWSREQFFALLADSSKVEPEPSKRPSDEQRRTAVLAALDRHGWQRTAAAQELGISRKTLWDWMHRLNISSQTVDS